MAQKKSKKKDKEKPELNQKELTTSPIKETSQEEIKPSFQELLKKKESSGPTTTDPRIEPLEADENIIEICKDIISVPFEIWNKINPKVEPLSESEKKHISQPLARIAVHYDLAKYMKDELLLVTFLGFAIYKRARIKKDDKNGDREKGPRKDEPDTRIN